MENLFSKLLFASLFFLPVISNATTITSNTNITGSVTQPQIIGADNLTINVISGGNIGFNTDDFSAQSDRAAPISSPDDFINTTINVGNVSTSGTIAATGNTAGAISISGAGASLLALTISSGSVSSQSNDATLFLGGSIISAPVITVGRDALGTATLSNISTNGNAISSFASSATNLTINNNATGTISVSGANKTAIRLLDSNFESSLLVNNRGTINAAGGTALSVVGFNSVINNYGVINGNISLDTSSSAAITLLAGTMTGNISTHLNTQNIEFAGGNLIGKINGSGNVLVSQDTQTQGNIGDEVALTSLTIAANKTLDAATNNNTIRANNILLSSGSLLQFNTNSLSGIIDGVSANTGTVNLVANSAIMALDATFGRTNGINAFNITASSSSITLQNSVKAITSTFAGNFAIILNPSQNITGNVLVDSGINFTLSNGSRVNGSVNALSSSGSGVLTIATSASVSTNGNIGNTNSLASVHLLDSSRLNLSTNSNSINASNIYLENSSTLTIGSASVTGAIRSFSASDTTASNNIGIVVFAGNNTLAGNVGTSDQHSLNRVTINAGRIVNAGNYEINSNNIVVGNSATLRSSSLISAGKDQLGNSISTSISLSSGATLNLQDGSNVNGVINGSAVGQGDIEISGTSTLSTVGASRRVEDLRLNPNSTATFNGNISANNFEINGNAIFNSPRLITANSFSINSGSSLSLIASTSATPLEVAGSVFLSANTILNLTISEIIAPTTILTLINSDSPSNLNKIGDANININDSGSNIYQGNIFTTYISGNSLLLLASLTPSPPNTNLILPSQNDQNIYDVIAGASNPTGSLETLQDYLSSNSYSAQDKEAAIKSVAPQIDNSVNRVAFNNVSTLGNIISSRLESVRNINFSAHSFGNSFANNPFNNSQISSDIFGGKFSASQILEPLSYDNIKTAAPMSIQFDNDDNFEKGAWIQTFGSVINQTYTNGGVGAYKANSSGIAVGFDVQKCKKIILGISASYAQSNIKNKNVGQNIAIDTYQASIYSGYNPKNFFLNSSVGIAINNYSSTRYIPLVNSEAKAKYSGYGYNIRFEIGKNFGFKNQIIFTPTFALTGAHNSINSYNESGADTLNLNSESDSVNFLEGRVGVDLSQVFTSKNGAKIRPQIFTSYGYDFIGNKQKATSAFIGQTNSFVSEGARIAQGSLKLGAGITFYTKRDLIFSLSYGLEKRHDYTSNSAWFKARFGF